MSKTPAIATSIALPVTTRIAYGLGSIAYGVKDGGFNYFLLLFYGTVIGLEPGLVGLAIFMALVIDALSDPLVGYVSDNWRSAWGRRHPFMYASALPVALSYFALWNPPALSQTGLFIYLLTMAVVIRTAITLYETPSSSLLPELTSDYDQRTRLTAYRYFFGWTGGASMSILMFGGLLVATPEYPVATLNRDGYTAYGIISSALMFVAILVSAVGTHSYIPQLPAAPAKRKLSLSQVFQEIYGTLADPSFVALFLSTLFGAIAAGVTASLTYLLYIYFWAFSEQQIFLMTLLVPISATGGFVIASPLSRWLGKKRAVIVLGVIAFTASPLLVVARLLNWLPASGDPLLWPIVAAVTYGDLALIIALQTIFHSMIADLVEHSALKTGRRSEGLFFAAVTFTRKATHGLGVLAAGVILSVIDFPQGADPGSVPEDVLLQLGAIYAPTIFVLYMAMMVMVAFYRIDRATHEANVRALNEQSSIIET